MTHGYVVLRRIRSCVVVWVALAGPVAAQQAAPITAIRTGTLIDGTGAAPLKNAVIVIQGERITTVGAVAIPRGAAVIDLSAYTVLPASSMPTSTWPSAPSATATGSTAT